MTETLYWVWLTSALGFSASSVGRVMYKFTPEEAYRASAEELMASGIGEAYVQKLSDKGLERAERIMALCQKKGIKIVRADSPEYPRALDRLDDSPKVLYVRGDLSCLKGKKTAAFIGTRRMSQTGGEMADEIAERLISAGYVLVSGIADGVDAVAAKKSLEKGIPTVAVLGVDIDKYYPKVNERLIDRVAEAGAVISEYPPETNARYFATRNRIIVGLSDILTVIEAPEGSGALIGARLALKKKIPTYTLDLEGDSFAGCRALLGMGATAINKGSTAPVKKTVPKKTVPKKTAEKPAFRSDKIPDDVQGMRRYIWKKLLDGPKTDNELIDEEHKIPDVLCALTELELDGYIKALPGGKYSLK